MMPLVAAVKGLPTSLYPSTDTFPSYVDCRCNDGYTKVPTSLAERTLRTVRMEKSDTSKSIGKDSILQIRTINIQQRYTKRPTKDTYSCSEKALRKVEHEWLARR